MITTPSKPAPARRLVAALLLAAAVWPAAGPAGAQGAGDDYGMLAADAGAQGTVEILVTGWHAVTGDEPEVGASAADGGPGGDHRRRIREVRGRRRPGIERSPLREPAGHRHEGGRGGARYGEGLRCRGADLAGLAGRAVAGRQRADGGGGTAARGRLYREGRLRRRHRHGYGRRPSLHRPAGGRRGLLRRPMPERTRTDGRPRRGAAGSLARYPRRRDRPRARAGDVGGRARGGPDRDQRLRAQWRRAQLEHPGRARLADRGGLHGSRQPRRRQHEPRLSEAFLEALPGIGSTTWPRGFSRGGTWRWWRRPETSPTGAASRIPPVSGIS